MEENNNLNLEPKNEKKEVPTIKYINTIILVAVIAFLVLGLIFRIASLHFLTIYGGGSYNYNFFNISSVFLTLDVLSTLGFGVFNFVMVFINKDADYKRRSTIYVITAIAIITLLVLAFNLL